MEEVNKDPQSRQCLGEEVEVEPENYFAENYDPSNVVETKDNPDLKKAVSAQFHYFLEAKSCPRHYNQNSGDPVHLAKTQSKI